MTARTPRPGGRPDPLAYLDDEVAATIAVQDSLAPDRIVLGGEPKELWGNEAIAAAYLGGHAKVSA